MMCLDVSRSWRSALEWLSMVVDDLLADPQAQLVAYLALCGEERPENLRQDKGSDPMYHERELTSEKQNYWSQDQQGHSEWQGKLAEKWDLNGSMTRSVRRMNSTRPRNMSQPSTGRSWPRGCRGWAISLSAASTGSRRSRAM